jgi:hypothetical protein
VRLSVKQKKGEWQCLHVLAITPIIAARGLFLIFVTIFYLLIHFPPKKKNRRDR